MSGSPSTNSIETRKIEALRSAITYCLKGLADYHFDSASFSIRYCEPPSVPNECEPQKRSIVIGKDCIVEYRYYSELGGTHLVADAYEDVYRFLLAIAPKKHGLAQIMASRTIWETQILLFGKYQNFTLSPSNALVGTWNLSRSGHDFRYEFTDKIITSYDDKNRSWPYMYQATEHSDRIISLHATPITNGCTTDFDVYFDDSYQTAHVYMCSHIKTTSETLPSYSFEVWNKEQQRLKAISHLKG